MAYDIFLYQSKTKIELLWEEDKLKFFEEGIRGGLSFASERLTDTRKSGKTMFHWDVNNLYGGSQAEALPSSDFRWHPNPEQFMDPDFINGMTPDVSQSRPGLIYKKNPHIFFFFQDPIGYWLECDIDFGKHLHKKKSFNCYPPLAETKVISYKMLSPKARKLLIKKVGKTAAKNYKSKKLISTLKNKKKYKIHYLNLKQAMKFGCKLKKVHRVISFKQEKFSKDFLNFMTERRKNSKTKLEERLCKGI